MVLSTLNWNFEVYTYLVASIIALLSVITIFREYLRVKSDFHLYLTISWLFLFVYIFCGGIAVLILSKTLFKYGILFLIPSAFFLIMVFDKLTRSALDPVKMLIFGITSSGATISLFAFNSIKSILLRSGYPSFQTSGVFHIWISIFTGLMAILFLYYCLVIFIRAPPHLRRKAFMTLLGGFFFSGISFFLYLSRLTKLIPGLMLVTLALGAFLASLSYYLEPKLLDVLITAEAEAKLKKISEFLPICANCKKIRSADDSWTSVETYFLQNSKILFSHGVCPECAHKYYSDIRDEEN